MKHMHLHKSILFSLFFFFSISSFAQLSTSIKETDTNESIETKKTAIQDILKKYDKALWFEENIGQLGNEDILFRAKNNQAVFRFLKTGVSIGVVQKELEEEDSIKAEDKARKRPRSSEKRKGKQEPQRNKVNGFVWNMNFLDANPNVKIEGQEKHSGTVNYISNERGKVYSNVNNFEEVWYHDVYEHIDARFYASENQELEYDFIVYPGGDKEDILVELEGVKDAQITDLGELIFQTPLGELKKGKPYVYQVINGTEKEIPSRYKLIDGNKMSFELLSDYDKEQPLIIDPIVLQYATFLGLGTAGYSVVSIDVDNNGDIVILANSDDINLPATPGTVGQAQGLEAIIAKFDASLSNILFITHLPGPVDDLNYPYVSAIATDQNNSIFFAGTMGFSSTGHVANGANLPTTSGAYQESHGLTNIGPTITTIISFLAKLNSDGTVLQAMTYLSPGGETGDDVRISDIEINSLGEVIAVGDTENDDFPETTATSPQQSLAGGGADLFVIKLDNNLSTLMGSTYLGGSDWETNEYLNVEIGPSDNIYVGSSTYSSDFPVTPGAYSTDFSTMDEAGTVTILNSDITSLVYSSFFKRPSTNLGGSYIELKDIAVNPDGSYVLTGEGESGAIPFTEGTYAAIPPDNEYTGVVAKFDASHNLVFACKISNNPDFSQWAFGLDAAMDPEGNVYVLGRMNASSSTQEAGIIPTQDGLFSEVENPGGNDWSNFLVKISADGSEMLYGTFLYFEDDMYNHNNDRLLVEDCKIYVGESTRGSGLGLPGTLNAYDNTQSQWDAAILVFDIASASDSINSISSSQNVCIDGRTAVIAGSDMAYTASDYVQDGAIKQQIIIPSYQWQSSNDGISWADISGASQRDFLPAPSSIDVYFRRIVGNDACSRDTSNVHLLDVGTDAAPTIDEGSVLSCPGIGVQIGALASGGSGGTYSYEWLPAAGLSDASIAQPIATIDASGTYNIVVTDDGNGCQIEEQWKVGIAVADAGPDASFCNGAEPALIGTPGNYGLNYSWTVLSGDPISTLSDPNIPQPLVGLTTPATTNYELTLTIPSVGCSTKDTVVVSPFNVSVFAGTDTTLCMGEDLILGEPATSGYSYGWAPGAYLSSQTIAQPTFFSSICPENDTYPETENPINFTLTKIHDASGCKQVDTISIAIMGTSLSDLCGETVQLGIQSDSCGIDLPGTTFNWSVLSGDASSITGQENTRYPVVTPSAITTYQLGVELNGKTCYNEMVVTSCFCGVSIGVESDIICPVGGQYNTVLNGNLTMSAMNPDGSLPTGFHYEWSPTFGLDNPTSLTTGVSALPQDTTYYLKIIDESDGSTLCVDSIRVYASFSADPFVGLTLPGYFCQDQVVTIGVPGVAGWNYQWTPSTGLSNPAISNPILTTSSTITYTLTSSDAVTGCSIEQPVDIAIRNPIINAGADGAFCDNAIVQLGTPAVPGQTYSWEPAFGLAEPNIAQPLDTLFISTQFILTVEDLVTGCTAKDTVNYTLSTPPVVDAGPNISVCSGGTGALIGPTSQAGYTYSWVPTDGLSDPNIAQPLANPSTETTYTLYASNGNEGCYAVENVTVSVGAAYTLNLSDVETCSADSVQIGIAEAGGTYSWTPTTGLGNPNSSSTKALPAATTTYTLTWTTPDGCQLSEEVLVTVLPIPTLGATDGTLCEGESTTIGTPSETGVNYVWTSISGDPVSSLDLTNIAQPTATPTQVTTYQVAASRPSGCILLDTVTVNVEGFPVVDLGADLASCGLDTLKAEIAGIPFPGEDHSASFEDVGLDGWIQDATDQFDWIMFSGSTSSTYTGPTAASVGDYYLYTEANLNYNDTARIVSPDILLSAATTSMSFDWHMYGSNMGRLSLDISTDGGTIWTNLWTRNGNTNNTNWTTEIIDLSTYSGTTVKLRFEGGVGTSYRSDMAIDNIQVSGATYLYSWNTLDTGPSLAISPTVETTYTVTVTSPAGCSAEDQIIVTPPFEVELGFDRELCLGESIDIGIGDLGAGYTYFWTPTAGLSASNVSNPTATPAATTTYVLTVDNGLGCIQTDSFTIIINPLPVLGFIDPQTICNGSCTSISVGQESGVSYIWSPSTGLNTTTGSSVTACPTVTTTYTITAISSDNCISTTNTTVNVVVDPPPVADAGSDQTICSGGSVELGAAAIPGVTYYWSSPDTDGITALNNAYISNPTVTLTNTSYATLVRTFIVDVVDNTTLCSSQDTVVINANRLPTVTVNSFPEFCEGGGSLQISSAYVTTYGSDLSFEWSPAAYFDDPTSRYPTLSITDSTYFTLIVTDTLSGCANSTSFSVNVSDEVFTVDAGQDLSLCLNETAIIGTVSPSTPLGFDHATNFDSGLNGWTNATDDDFNWTRKYRYATSTANTGPSGPVTNWYYMYTETGGRPIGDSARLVSPSINVDALTTNISFDYHMYGAQMGTMKLDVSTDGGISWISLWSLSGDQGDAWNKQVVDISAYSGSTVHFSFVGILGGTSTSDIGLENVSIPGTGPAYNWSFKSLTSSSFNTSTFYYVNGTTRYDAQPNARTNNTVYSGTYKLEGVSEGGCLTSDEMTITIQNEVDTIEAGTDQYICGNSETYMNPVNPSTGSKSWSQVSGPNTALIDDPSANNTLVSGLINGVYVFKWEISNVCNAGADYVTIEVIEAPVLITQPIIACGVGNITTAEATAGSNNLGSLTYWLDSLSTTQLLRPDSITISGTYYIKTLTAEGCEVIESIAVNTLGCSSVVGNRIWLDENSDGIQDAGEPGIAGVVVELQDGTCSPGTDCPTTITDSDGGYIFRNVFAGNYTVAVLSNVPTGLNAIYDEDSGTTSPDMTATVIVGASEYVTADFGYNYTTKADTDNPTTMLETGAIGNRIWNDANGNGVQDPGESGIAGITINLLTDPDQDGIYTPSGTTTTTDAYGNYIFDGLAPGAYEVEVVTTGITSAGFTTTPTADPDNDGTNISEAVILAPGDVWLGGDFGYNNPSDPFDIGSTVFVDVDGDGSYSAANDLPIAGVTVALIEDTNANGIWDTGEALVSTTVTASDGSYLFPDLADDNYVVAITDVNNVINDLTNSVDPDGASDGYSAVNLSGANELTQNFGYVPAGHVAGTGFIGDMIYLDMDGSNDFTAGEPGMEGVEVQLLDAATSAVLATSTTNENGMYYFGNLADDDYIVKVNTTTIPTGLENSSDPDGGSPANDEGGTVTISSGSSNLSQDFGYKATTPHMISGTIWEDSNAEGTLDGTEAARYEGITIDLIDVNGNIIASTITATNGTYSFTQIPDGIYTVEVTDTRDSLMGMWHSLGTDSENDPVSVTVSGSDLTGVDFGYYQKGASIGNMVWLDYNGDNAQDVGEPGLPNAKITLEIDYNNDGTVDVTVVTMSDVDGSYSFENLMLDEDYNGVGSPPDYELIVTLPNADMDAAYTEATADLASGNDRLDSDLHIGQVVVPMQGQSDISLKTDANTETTEASYDFGYTLDCSSPVVEYAITMDATDAGAAQTTDYFVDSTSTTMHNPMIQKDGSIRSWTYCEVNGWRYYYNPMDPDEYLFAIEHGANTTEIEYVEIRVDDNAADRYASGATDATFVMVRDWHVKTKDDAALTANVNIRFYFPPNEYKQMLDAAKAQATAWGTSLQPTEAMVEWFKKDVFNPDADINTANTILSSYDITTLRVAASDAIGNNTALATPTVENSRNHIQFDGITDFSEGGTAMIHINRASLPVELSMFRGEVIACQTQLSWQAETEEAFSHYELEWSGDGHVYKMIEKIAGSGGLTMSQFYQYFDEAASINNYYRLKMVDMDGSIEYSDVVYLKTSCEEEFDIIIYPNPVGINDGVVGIKFYAELEETTLVIVDITGQVVRQLNIGVEKEWNTLRMDIEDLAVGVYFVKVLGSKGAKRFVIQE